MDVARLIENFEVFDDWDDRYRYLIDLGRKLDPLSDTEKTAENKVDGCISQVWMTGKLVKGSPDTLEIRADSDAFIVKGLIAILLTIFSGKTPVEIIDTDIKKFFERLDLGSHISINRRNGFYSMVQRIRHLARQHL